MDKFDEYLDKAKELAEEEGGMAKNLMGEVVDKAKELADEHGKVKELAKSAKEQSATLAFGAKEKVQGILQDAKTGKEIKQGINELENLPELEGSILYSMELGTMVNDLSSLYLIINDSRMDDASVIEEIRKVLSKVQPAGELPEDASDEQKAIEKAKTIAFSACKSAMEVLNISE